MRTNELADHAAARAAHDPADPGGRASGATTPTRSGGRDARPRAHIGRVVAGSAAVGLLAGALLAVAPFVPPTEAGVTSAVLCGGAVGWATSVVLSTRGTGQPQRWAAVPALFLGVSGLLLVAFGAPVHEALTWVWPPAVLALVVWMVRRARRELRSPGGRRLLLGALAVLALASVAGGVETVRAAAEATARPMPGRLIDVGGHRLHLSCTGSGGPTVVLEPGAGLAASDVGLVAAAVARDTRVCRYDRAGRGWSEPADAPQDARQIATDLRTLLRRGHVPGPYVLAGHSFGGLYALTFAARHPDEVAGMVLVDSTAPAAATSSASAGTTGDLADRAAALAAAAARLGLGRLVGVPTPSHLESIVDEYAQGGPSAEQAASLHDLADTPLVVLTAGVGQSDGWGPAQEALATLSSHSVHRVVEGVDHGGLVGDARGAAATTRAILDVVASLRSGQPLAR